MHAVDLNAAHRHATDAARLVRCLADRVHLIGESTGEGWSGFDDLAVSIDALAADASTAVEAIDACLEQASRHGAGPDAAGACQVARYELALRLIGLLDQLLDSAVAIYRLACSQLADRLSLAEEHLPIPTATTSDHLTSAVLVQHTRALAASPAARAAL